MPGFARIDGAVFGELNIVQIATDSLDAADIRQASLGRSYPTILVLISPFGLHYADDGQGFAIGFSPTLMRTPAKPLRVLYDENAQMQELIGNLKHTFSVEKSTGFKYDDKFQRHMFNVGLDLCAYKNPMFREENEIGLAHLCGVVPEGKSKKIIPLGASDSDGGRLSEPLSTFFRVRKGVIVPYVTIYYSNKNAVAPIKEIVLGPRNENNETDIEVFLNTIGATNVTVRRSEVPYR